LIEAGGGKLPLERVRGALSETGRRLLANLPKGHGKYGEGELKRRDKGGQSRVKIFEIASEQKDTNSEEILRTKVIN